MLIEDQYTQRMTLLNPNVLSISWRQGRRKNPAKLDGLLLSKFDECEETGKLWLPNTTQEPQISVRSMTTDPESKITLISLMGQRKIGETNLDISTTNTTYCNDNRE